MKIIAFIRERLPRLSIYFSTLNWKNILTFLLFLLLAFIFWLMLFFQRKDVDGIYRIPLKYTNVPADVVFNNPLPEFIEISVSDNGNEIFLLDLKKFDSLEIDVADITKDGQSTLQGERYSQLLRSKLPSSTYLRGYLPMSISLETSKLKSKKVSIKFDGEISTTRANLVVDSITFIPKTITAYGSGQSLQSLDTVYTEYTSFKNLRKTSQLPVKIKPIDKIKFSQSEVQLHIPISEYTERSFQIPISVTHLPTDIDVKFFPSRVDISFSVTLEEYKSIAPEDFEISVDYRDFHNNENGKVELKLTSKPKFIDDVRITPSSVEFLFEKK